MKDKIKHIMSGLFETPVEEIGDDASTDTLKAWNSLNHLNLVLALEDEFGITFDDNEVLEMVTLELIVLTLKEKGLS